MLVGKLKLQAEALCHITRCVCVRHFFSDESSNATASRSKGRLIYRERFFTARPLSGGLFEAFLSPPGVLIFYDIVNEVRWRRLIEPLGKNEVSCSPAVRSSPPPPLIDLSFQLSLRFHLVLTSAADCKVTSLTKCFVARPGPFQRNRNLQNVISINSCPVMESGTCDSFILCR